MVTAPFYVMATRKIRKSANNNKNNMPNGASNEQKVK